MDHSTQAALVDYLLNLGDDCLVLGHRLSEWCGHGPYLEEDIALGNIALDCLGQANLLLGLAGTVEGKNRSADQLAYWRDETQFRNHLLVEQLNGDFGFTVVRQFFFDVYAYVLFEKLALSEYTPLAEIAQKAVKETVYHLRHSREWVIRLGDGTAESHARMKGAIDEFWPYTAELFREEPGDELLIAKQIIPRISDLHARWVDIVDSALSEAKSTRPGLNIYMYSGGREGKHTEYLGHMLAEMQSVARAHPGAVW